jgi:hydroxypyruvate isomerase
MNIKQSVCVPMYRKGTAGLGDFLKELRGIGYAAVEFWGREMLDDFPGALEQARKHGLAVSSMIGHGALGDGLNKVENHDRIEAELRQSIDIAVANGIAGLICFSGNRNPGQSDLAGLVACAQGLKRIAPYAEQKGVNLNVELLNSRIDHAGYQCDRTDWGVALCEMVGSPRVKLLYDIYHMQIMEGDVIRTIRTHAARFGHYHTAGVPGRKDPDDSQELNYRAICRAIAETGYDGYVGHEYAPRADVLASLRAMFALCDVQGTSAVQDVSGRTAARVPSGPRPCP